MISALSDRSQHSSLTKCIYLNQASLGLIGQPAVTAMHEFLEDVGRHGNMNMSDSDEVAFFSLLRAQAAAILNCQPDRLAIVSSAGEMLSQLPFLFRPPGGSRILAVSSDFPAITRPWIAYAAENDCELRFVDDHAAHDLTESLIQNIDERTSVVAVSYVQFST
jgi:selenocysteine lyase/cysteine desulfurase